MGIMLLLLRLLMQANIGNYYRTCKRVCVKRKPYLNQLIQEGILSKLKLGRENYYINDELFHFILNAFIISRIWNVKP